jgi:hypothetical protein
MLFCMIYDHCISIDLPPRNSITSLTIPTACLMSLSEFREAIQANRHLFEDMMDNLSHFEAHNHDPDLTFEVIVNLH